MYTLDESHVTRIPPPLETLVATSPGIISSAMFVAAVYSPTQSLMSPSATIVAPARVRHDGLTYSDREWPTSGIAPPVAALKSSVERITTPTSDAAAPIHVTSRSNRLPSWIIDVLVRVNLLESNTPFPTLVIVLNGPALI